MCYSKKKFQRLLNCKVWKKKNSRNSFNLYKDPFKDQKDKRNSLRRKQRHKMINYSKSNSYKYNCKIYPNKVKLKLKIS